MTAILITCLGLPQLPQVCAYKGIFCVEELNCPDCLLPFAAGCIPKCLGQLKNLEFVNMGGSQLFGKFFLFVPPIVIWIPLIFFLCFFTGSIPGSLGSLKNLIRLHLDNNRLDGHYFHFWGGCVNAL